MRRKGERGVKVGSRENLEKWLASDVVDEATKAEIRSIENDENEVNDRFTAMLEFGTAGLRGVMRAGLNGMNIYTVRYATQGLANLINSCGEEIGGGVAIAYDSRINSPEFSKEAASVLAANGIHVNLFDALRPTPELSFAIRETGSIAGINITASHNTKEYNGYKAYWSDGAQLPPEHAAEVLEQINSIDIFEDVKTMPFEEALSSGYVDMLGVETDEKYMSKVLEQSVGKEYVDKVADDFTIIYTPFHGAGLRIVPEVLKRLGMKHVLYVEEQMIPDGTFPTVKSPNPENKEGFNIAIEMAKKNNVDLIIGTDPDADRCGTVVKAGDGYVTISGNQMGALLLDYIITARREQGTLPENAAAIKSIVSTMMVNKIAEENGVKLFEVLTGFKFIGEKIKEFETTGEYEFIFGFEESYGYLAGTYARDKDAVVAAMLIAEMACYYKTKGMNLYEAMNALYKKYGYFKESTTSVVFEGFGAQERMKDIMAKLRENAPSEIGLPVIRVRDFQKREIMDVATGQATPLDYVKSDVLYYDLEGGNSAVIRPSGTEPKVKLYVLANGGNEAEADEIVAKVTAAGKELLA